MTNKEIILQTALQLFARQGYDRSPTSQIAREAGVSEGLVFRHYGNKAGLLSAIIQSGMTQIVQSMQAYEQDLPGKAAIVAHIKQAFHLVQANETFWRLVQTLRFQPVVQDTASQQIEAVNRFIIGNLTQHFQKLNTEQPEQEALLLFAQIDGIALHYLSDPAHYPLPAMQQILIDKYQHGYILD